MSFKRASSWLTPEPAFFLIDNVGLRLETRRIVQLNLVTQVQRWLNHVADFDNLLLFVVPTDLRCLAVGNCMCLVLDAQI